MTLTPNHRGFTRGKKCFGEDVTVLQAGHNLGVHLVPDAKSRSCVLSSAKNTSLAWSTFGWAAWCVEGLRGVVVRPLPASRTRQTFMRQAPLCWHISLLAVIQRGASKRDPKCLVLLHNAVLDKYCKLLTVNGISCCDVKQSCVTRKTVGSENHCTFVAVHSQ